MLPAFYQEAKELQNLLFFKRLKIKNQPAFQTEKRSGMLFRAFVLKILLDAQAGARGLKTIGIDRSRTMKTSIVALKMRGS